MSPIILIPARMASTRLPGKPLADIGGEPMIVHVWRRAVASGVGEVAVACAEAEIARAIEKAGGRAVMTDPDLPSGSDRIWQALERLDPQGRYDTVVNVQGDMPTLDPALIRQALALLADPAADIATLAAEITEEGERSDPAVVKVAMSRVQDSGFGIQGKNLASPESRIPNPEPYRALYFSRSPIPYGPGPLYHHIGLYAYCRPALGRFVALPPSPLEIREKLEQLRALEAGMTIAVAVADTVPLGVDTPETLERARRMMDDRMKDD